MDARLQTLQAQLDSIVVGKSQAVRLTLTALLAGGHALLEDVPGVGKTLLAKAIAQSIAGSFQRIQCTPDLLPSDITGTNIWNPQNGAFEFIPGPIFANICLADEINRATPRTQAAMLEVMEEEQVTIDGTTRPVPEPFFAIATQNPIEYQGTFTLPEAQLDRFALSFSLGYPELEDELDILRRQQKGSPLQELKACLSLADVTELRQACLQVKVTESLQRYILAVVRATRTHPSLVLGASPRGSVMLQRTAQAWAYLLGRNFVIPDDVKTLAPYVLSHRVLTDGSGTAMAIVGEILAGMPVE
ncbi:MAG: MoxR family ATPase [Cyanobacteria bacterium J06642_2]